MIRNFFATTLAFSLLMVTLGGGCSSGGSSGFSGKVGQINVGDSKTTVQRELGKPDERKMAVAGAQPADPQPPATVNVGSRYEDWIYRRDGREYHVFLGASTTHQGQWEVHKIVKR